MVRKLSVAALVLLLLPWASAQGYYPIYGFGPSYGSNNYQPGSFPIAPSPVFVQITPVNPVIGGQGPVFVQPRQSGLRGVAQMPVYVPPQPPGLEHVFPGVPNLSPFLNPQR